MLKIQIGTDAEDEGIGELRIIRDVGNEPGKICNYTVSHFADKDDDKPMRTFRLTAFDEKRGVYACAAMALSQLVFEVDEGR